MKSRWSSSVRGAEATLFLSRSITYLLIAMAAYTFMFILYYPMCMPCGNCKTGVVIMYFMYINQVLS